VEVELMQQLEKEGLRLYELLAKNDSTESIRLKGLLEDLPAWG
jgi:hypothetical protein|tara:strand:- start:448 stop:576 length:129 start_codon:yes stop_codon:yes gene_type:complete